MGGILSKIAQKCSAFFQKLLAIFKKRSVKVALALLLVGLAGTAVFFYRKPVILITDNPFNLLYGEKRARYTRLGLSLRLFRQIKTINIAEGAGPDLVAQAAASLSRRPYWVFFPYRYREGARRYLKDRPGSPASILGGRNRPENGKEPDSTDPWWFCTDIAADLYRAGFLAGELALQDPEKSAAALYHDRPGDEEKAFSQGLSEQGWSEAPYISSSPESTSRFVNQKTTCIVLLKKADSRFFEGSGSIILFSWSDPSLAPGKTAAIFDDSSWAQLGPALKTIKKEGISPGIAGLSLVPSRLMVFNQKFGQKKGIIGINRIKSLRYMERNTDNNNNA